MQKYSMPWLIASFLMFSLSDAPQAIAARASVTVAPYFSNHMIIQRDQPIVVWGTASTGTVMIVSFQNQTVSVSADANGKWKAELGAMPANDMPNILTVVGGGKQIDFTDVLVGDVWVLSGQSNINVQLKDCIGGSQAVTHSADYPNLRLYLVPQTGPLTEQWEVSNPTNTSDWSGMGFFFAQELFDYWRDTNQMLESVPIGLIQVAKNGTPISDWTTYGGSNNGKLYKEKIVPLQSLAIRGVLWYQGEDDGSRETTALKYYDMLPHLIANWRTDWRIGDFPFYYVQLALISGRPTWAILRDAQVSTLDVTTNTAMACIIDIPTIPVSDIHPKDKEPVGDRLALAALAQVYGETALVYSGPIRNAAKSSLQGNTVIIGFDHTDSGLVTDDGLAPGPFLLAGADGVYYQATAQIIGDTIAVSSPLSVPTPKFVRYCWDSYPLCNLFNGEHLPASPFHLAP